MASSAVRAAAAVAILVSLGVAVTAVLSPAHAEETYQVPPPALVNLIDTPPTPYVSIGPRQQWLLIMEQPPLPPISELAEPELRLAGRRIKPTTNGPSRARYLRKLTFQEIEGGRQVEVKGLPEEARIDDPRWSPDGRRVAFTVTSDRDITLWMVETGKAKAKQVFKTPLNATMGRPYEWLGGDRGFVCLTVPRDRGPEPPAPTVPSGPVVQENVGRVAPARTYQDLLEGPHDEALFEYHFSAQVVAVNLKGKARPIGEPGIVGGFDGSPDGRYILTLTRHRPFSYLVPHYRFPNRVEIHDLDGNLVRELVDLPLQEEVPMAFGSVPTGPRNISWRDDAPATLTWVEAQDGGDAKAEAEVRDRLFQLAAPFEGAGVPMMDFELRYGGVAWGNDDVALGTEWWWQTRQLRTWRLRPGTPGAEPVLVHERSFEDRYADPGEPMTHENEWGRDVLLLGADGETLFLLGDGASEEGDRPFLDTFNLATEETNRLWRSEAPYFARVVDLLDPEAKRVILRREAPDVPPNYHVMDLGSGAREQLTFFPNPQEVLEGMEKELIRYERADGVMLTGTLYLPPGYDRERDGPLPMLMWAYPQEFKSADAAGQVTNSPYRFDRIGWWSPLLWLTRGYAVLDDPTMPIIGEGDVEPNDTYVEQLVASAHAAVEEVVRRGVADRDRIAVGGHSYGAFMTANLLAHSDLYRAGIARSGAYNRTLTPFGFQAEERSLWEAPEIYFAMSPFMHAEKMNEPLLLIHGQADNNSGTFPMQSERYYGALKGLGQTARLVMLPHESHGYRARESILHMLWESDQWLEEYVKNAGPREDDAAPASSQAR